mmetsp:Transcript_95957/g.117592  ORF Transcript_95957/g.117592 Transcript_95957/m.117592 type:complete len:126 (-) Transcript_95957:272-649(-)
MATMEAAVQASNGLLQWTSPARHRSGAGSAFGVDSAQIHSSLNDEAVLGVNSHSLSIGRLWACGEIDSSTAKADVPTAETTLKNFVSSPSACLMVQGADIASMPNAMMMTAGMQGGHFSVVVVRL